MCETDQQDGGQTGTHCGISEVESEINALMYYEKRAQLEGTCLFKSTNTSGKLQYINSCNLFN